MAIHAMTKHYKHHSLEEALAVLKKVLDEPAAYKEDEMLGKIASALMPTEQAVNDEVPLVNELFKNLKKENTDRSTDGKIVS